MANTSTYNPRWEFVFESVNRREWTITIYQKDYTGDVVKRALGRAPVLKKEENDHITGTSLEIYAECITDGEFAEIYSTDPYYHYVMLTTTSTEDDTPVTVFEGYVSPELYAEPDIAPPYDVQIIATDGIGELKYQEWVGYGNATLRSFFNRIINALNFPSSSALSSSSALHLLNDMGVVTSLLCDEFDFLDAFKVNMDYYAETDSSGAARSVYEALSDVLETLNATLVQYQGKWIILRETAISYLTDEGANPPEVKVFDKDGNDVSLSESVQIFGSMASNDTWPVGQMESKIEPAKKSIHLSEEIRVWSSLFTNPGMTEDSGWNTYGTAVFVDPSQHTYRGGNRSTRTYYMVQCNFKESSMSFDYGCNRIQGAKYDFYPAFGLDLALAVAFVSATGYTRVSPGTIGEALVELTYTLGGATIYLSKDSDGALAWTTTESRVSLGEVAVSAGIVSLELNDIPAVTTYDSLPSGYTNGYLRLKLYPDRIVDMQVYSCYLKPKTSDLEDVTLDVNIDNNAREAASDVALSFLELEDDSSYDARYGVYFYGVPVDSSGDLITDWGLHEDPEDTAAFTDFTSFIAMMGYDYSRLYALPRLTKTGKLDIPGALSYPVPLVLKESRTGLYFYLRTYSFDLLEDELEVSLQSLPNVSITS